MAKKGERDDLRVLAKGDKPATATCTCTSGIMKIK